MQDIDLKRREMLIAAGAAAGAAALPMKASAQAPIIIKFSHVVAVDTPKGKGAEKFKELAEKRLPGKVKVEVYPNSTLYKDGEELEALSLGSVHLLAPSLAKFGPLGAREFEVFDLPYMFDNSEELHKVTEGPAGKALFKKLESKGITGLAYWDNGFKIMTSNKPMKTPADMRGQKIRIQSSAVLSAQMKALGALPQSMAFSEVYQAMQTGVVDGGENTPSNVYTQKMHEVQKHATLTNHGYIGYAVITNKKFWTACLPTSAPVSRRPWPRPPSTRTRSRSRRTTTRSPRSRPLERPRSTRRTRKSAPRGRRRWSRCTPRWKAGSARTPSRPCTRKQVSNPIKRL